MSTEANNIIEGNKLIAEFMGKQPKPMNLSISHNYGEWIEQCYFPFEYDTSWDWLMPVVEKIIAHKFYQEEDEPFEPETAWLRTFGMINNETGDVMVRFNRFQIHFGKTLIDATWQAVVDFIQWYNK